MDKKEIGKLTSFPRLMQEMNSLVIPKVQRDFAYGRKEEKVEKVLDGLLSSIFDALIDKKINILDFVYGGSYVKKSGKSSGMIPLDGQQRLTTLFLLFFFASLLGKKSTGENGENPIVPIDEKELDFLLGFKYETRITATEFCSLLIKDLRKKLIEKYKYNPENNNIKSLIIDDSLFVPSFFNDPTINSMLNVLEVIERKAIEYGAQLLNPSLWERLTKDDTILFYNLRLEKFGLTDDLYIKMNARGKHLTQFEIFKSNMVAQIKSIDEDLKDEFVRKMDNQWIDIVWSYTDKTINDSRNGSDVTKGADEKYAQLFNNIFRLEYYRRRLDTRDANNPGISTILNNREGVESVMKILDTLSAIHKNEGFKVLWNKYYFFSDVATGGPRASESIRLFWNQKQRPVFELALDSNLTLPELIYLYSFYLLYNSQYSMPEWSKCLRIIRNLVTTNVRLNDARYDKLNGFLNEIKYIVENKGIPVAYSSEDKLKIDGKEHKLSFNQNAWNEEYVKSNLMKQTDYETLLKYENHEILIASLSLFMDYFHKEPEKDKYTRYTDEESESLIVLLEKFRQIYADNYPDYFSTIQGELLNSDLDYMQYDPYMEKDDKITKEIDRYFLTKSSELSGFYIKYIQRKNQDAILSLLQSLPLPQAMELPEDLAKKFSMNDWKYYLLKYSAKAYKTDTSYSIGIWEDRDKYPLDLIWLNSSRHSENNLEWKMLTYILWKCYEDHIFYALDNHGCSPINITKISMTIGFVKDGWILDAGDKAADAEIKISGKYPELELTRPADGLIKIRRGDSSKDYIEIGQDIITLLEPAEPATKAEGEADT